MRRRFSTRAAIGQVGSAALGWPGVTAPDHQISHWPRQIDSLRKCRSPGLPHYQEFVLIEGVCVVVEFLLGLGHPQNVDGAYQQGRPVLR